MDVHMSRSEVGLNEAPVAMMASSPTAAAGGTSLVRPIARLASPHTGSSSGSSDARAPLKKRAIRECFGDDDEIPEPPRLRRQKVINWRHSGLQHWSEHTNNRPVRLFTGKGVDLQFGPNSKPMTIPQLGYKNNKTTKSRGDAVPLFGSWSREPLFVDDDTDTDTEMELESITKPHTTQQGRDGWTEMQSFAVTPSPHPMDMAQSPLPFRVPSDHGDDAPTSPVSPQPLQYYHDMDADADMGVLDQEGSDWFISSKVNELTRLHEHEYEGEHEFNQCELEHEYDNDYAGGMDMHHHHDSSPIKSSHPSLATLPGFPKPGGTIQDMMKELIIPTPDPTPPRDFSVHYLHHGQGHHRSSTGSNNDHYDPNISMMQHPGAYPTTTNGSFETNSSFSPVRIDQANRNDGNNHDSTATTHAARDQSLFWASNAERSSAFAPGHDRDWYGAGYYNDLG